MTKAEIIFDNISIEARHAVDFWGIGKIDAVAFDMTGTDGMYCQRTINAVRKQLESYARRVQMYVGFGVLEDARVATECIRIMRNTIDNAQKVVDSLK